MESKNRKLLILLPLRRRGISTKNNVSEDPKHCSKIWLVCYEFSRVCNYKTFLSFNFFKIKISILILLSLTFLGEFLHHNEKWLKIFYCAYYTFENSYQFKFYFWTNFNSLCSIFIRVWHKKGSPFMDLDKFQEPIAAIKTPYNSARESTFINPFMTWKACTAIF